jgi:hypothetical protein
MGIDNFSEVPYMGNKGKDGVVWDRCMGPSGAQWIGRSGSSEIVVWEECQGKTESSDRVVLLCVVVCCCGAGMREGR